MAVVLPSHGPISFFPNYWCIYMQENCLPTTALPAKLNSPTKWCRRHASNWLQDSWISRRFMQILSLLKVHSQLQLQVFDLKWPTKRENIERIRTEIFLTIFCAKMQTFIGSEKKENGENGGSFLTPQNHLFFDCQWGFLSMALLTRFEVKLKLNWKNNSVFV